MKARPHLLAVLLGTFLGMSLLFSAAFAADMEAADPNGTEPPAEHTLNESGSDNAPRDIPAGASLTVDGTDALAVSSGAGWSFDPGTGVLTLDGYHGGSILASNMDLHIQLTGGSRNTVTAADDYGIAFLDPHITYGLTLTGETGSSLEITSLYNAIYSNGDLTITGCHITAKSTLDSDDEKADCLRSRDNLYITGSTLNVTSECVGILAYDILSIENSDITVHAGINGIHANNYEPLSISDSQLEVYGGDAALYSYFGYMELENCSGELEGGAAAVYCQNKNSREQTTRLKNCGLELTGPYGMLLYEGVEIDGGRLELDCSGKGIWAYSAEKDVEAAVLGEAELLCSPDTPLLLDVRGSYTAAETAGVNGIVDVIAPDDADSQTILSGEYTLRGQKEFTRPVLIPVGAEITVDSEAGSDLTAAPSFTNNGTLHNYGSTVLNGGTAQNNGEIYNYSRLSLADGKAVENTGTIYSLCTTDFDLAPYGEKGIAIHPTLNTDWSHDDTAHWYECPSCGAKADAGEHTYEWIIDKQPGSSTPGSRHEACTVCGAHGRTEEIPPTGTGGGSHGDNDDDDDDRPSRPQEPGKVEEAENPDTGDRSALSLAAGILALSAAAALCAALPGRKD